MGLVVLMAVMFWLGHATARPKAPQQQPGQSLSDRTHVQPGVADPNRAAPPPSGDRIKGKYYLIIDRMKGLTDKDRLDAEAIIAYLKGHDTPATLAQLADKYWAVWSLTPFESPDSEQAKEFAKKIEDLGSAYRPPPGRTKYNFLQRRQVGAKLEPSYYRAP
jgi:hypothetical protein